MAEETLRQALARFNDGVERARKDYDKGNLRLCSTPYCQRRQRAAGLCEPCYKRERRRRAT